MKSIFKKDPGRAGQNSLATAETNLPNLKRIIKLIPVEWNDLWMVNYTECDSISRSFQFSRGREKVTIEL